MIIDIFRFTGIRKKMIMSFSVLIFFILVFQQIVSYYIMRITVQNINKNYITIGLQQKDEKIYNFLDEIDMLSKTVISNKDMQSLLIKDRDINSSISKISPEIRYALSNTIEGVFLVSKNGNIYKEVDIELDEYIRANLNKIKQVIEPSKGEIVFLKSQFVNYGLKNHGDYFFLAARKIKSIDSFKEIGIMIIAIRESRLWDRIIADSDVGDFYITNSNGDIISSMNKRLIGENIYNTYDQLLKANTLAIKTNSYISNKAIINFSTNELSNWKLLNVVPIKKLNSNYSNIQRIIFAFGVVAIIVAVYISVVISRRITNPIRDLINSMKEVMKGKLDVQIGKQSIKNSTDELKELNDVFNRMTRRLQYLIEQVYQEKIREREAELRALKAQINPHFLYNTLDTIYWMLIEEGNEEVAKLVTKLGGIFRYSIKKGSNTVIVREEIEQVENYLFIQKARFEDSLEYKVDVEESILDYEVPSFLIQPFVENSINHGIMHGKDSGKVLIKGYCINETIHFEIIDDGIGMIAKQIKDLYNNKNKTESSHTGIGVANVHERIKFIYGQAYGVDIESKEGYGTKVTVRVPISKPEAKSYET